MKNFLYLIAIFFISHIAVYAQDDIYLTQPFGGEHFTTGTSVSIQWQTTQTGTADIEFTSDGGGNWSVLQSDVALSAGSINWNIPEVSSTECRIKITPNPDDGSGTTSSNFAIDNRTNLEAVVLDESYDEWQNYADIGGLATPNSTFSKLKAFNDNRFLFLWFQMNETILFQSNNSLVIYIDTDDNPSTGLQVQGIGAEIEFHPGARSGSVHINGSSQDIGAMDLFLISSPTVISDRFELSIDRNATISGNSLFSGDKIRILITDESNGAMIPETLGGAKYRFGSYTFENIYDYSIEKQNEKYLRIVSHNVEFDAMFKQENQEHFNRLYKSIQPQIIGLQEIYNHNATDITNYLEGILPSPAGKSWNASNINDTWVATRYAIKNTYSPGGFGNGAFLLDLRPDYQTDMLFISAHPSCCDNDASRQNEVDAIAAFIRDAKNPGGVLTLAESTPIVVLGDMNFVGDTFQLNTLLNGDIYDEATYGVDYIPDWDETSFEDANPLVTHLPMSFTQGNSYYSGSYSKGRLDYIIYSGSVLEMKNSYVCYTHSMPSDTLSTYSLLENDTESASDHFPVVADFLVYSFETQDHSILPLRQNNSEGTPIFLGQSRTISGTVTVSDEFGSNGPAFIQDSGAGIALYGSEFVSQLNMGDSVTISGVVGSFNGLTELLYSQMESNIEIHTNTTIPQAETVTIADIINQNWDSFELLEGKLLRLENVWFSESGTFQANINYTLNDGTNTVVLRIYTDTGIPGNVIPQNDVIITACLGQYKPLSPYDSGYQLLPRTYTDIQSVSEISYPKKNNIEAHIHPNPSYSTATLIFNNTKHQKLMITISDLSGSLVKRIADNEFAKGEVSLSIDIEELPAGIYFCRIINTKNVQTLKFVKQ